MKLLKAVVFICLILLLLWFLLSFAEVNAKNSQKDPQYCGKNIFVMISKEDKNA